MNTNHVGRYESECAQCSVEQMGVRGHECAHVHMGVIARANVIVGVIVSEGGCESECAHIQE